MSSLPPLVRYRVMRGTATELIHYAEIHHSPEEHCYIACARLRRPGPAWDLEDSDHPWSQSLEGGDTLRECSSGNSCTTLDEAEQWVHDLFAHWPTTEKEWTLLLDAEQRALRQLQTTARTHQQLRDAARQQWEADRLLGYVTVVRYAALDGVAVAQKEFVGTSVQEQAEAFLVQHNTPTNIKYGTWKLQPNPLPLS